jgi:hypothetical protein
VSVKYDGREIEYASLRLVVASGENTDVVAGKGKGRFSEELFTIVRTTIVCTIRGLRARRCLCGMRKSQNENVIVFVRAWCDALYIR